jgi:hypothetical protein
VSSNSAPSRIGKQQRLFLHELRVLWHAEQSAIKQLLCLAKAALAAYNARVKRSWQVGAARCADPKELQPSETGAGVLELRRIYEESPECPPALHVLHDAFNGPWREQLMPGPLTQATRASRCMHACTQVQSRLNSPKASMIRRSGPCSVQ